MARVTDVVNASSDAPLPAPAQIALALVVVKSKPVDLTIEGMNLSLLME